MSGARKRRRPQHRQARTMQRLRGPVGNGAGIELADALLLDAKVRACLEQAQEGDLEHPATFAALLSSLAIATDTAMHGIMALQEQRGGNAVEEAWEELSWADDSGVLRAALIVLTGRVAALRLALGEDL